MLSISNDASSDQLSDEDIIQALALGNVWAMDVLYQRYAKVSYALCYHFVVDNEDAQNITQEAFLAIWRHASTYSPKIGSVQSWLISIVRNKAIDYVRILSHRSNIQVISVNTIREEQHPVLPDSWDEAWQSIVSTQIRTALLLIPTEQQMVIVLAYFQGWTHAEIAKTYGLPIGTVKGRIRQGLLHLKRALVLMGIDET